MLSESLSQVNSKNLLKFNFIDILVTACCILGDKMLNITLLIYCLAIYIAFRLFTTTVAYNFALLIILVPNIGAISVGIAGISIPILNILICIALFKLVISFIHQPIKKDYLLIITLFILYEWAHALYYDLKSILLLFSWTSAILYISLFLIYTKRTYNHMTVIKYFIAGVFISIIFGILDFYSIYGSLLNNNATIRFRGGAGDSNYFSMYIMIAMFSMLYLVNRQTTKFSKVLYPVLFVFFVAFGVLSLSRMFLLVVTFLSILLLIKIVISLKKSKKLLFFIMIVTSFLALFTFYFNEEFTSIIALLFSRFTDFIDDPAALTSNRNVIAEKYINLMTTDVLDFVFGIGIQQYHIRSGILLETHNILLELFVVWGVIGFLLFSIFLVTLFKNSVSNKTLLNTNLISWLPLICMGVSYMSLNALSNESFFVLLLFAIRNIYEFE